MFQRGGRPRLQAEAARHRRRLSRPLRCPGPAVQGAGQADQRRARPAVPQGHRDPGRAGPLPGGHRRHRRGQGHRQGRPRRQTLLLHRRRRLPHLLRHHLRPLPVPPARRSRRARRRSARSSARPATPWTRSRWPRNCPTSTWATTSTARTSGPTATPRPPGSTASRRRRWCIYTSDRLRRTLSRDLSASVDRFTRTQLLERNAERRRLLAVA